jgi:NAD(P)H-dependent FMN reductase
MRLLAISGSLRAASINSQFCRAVIHLAPPWLQVSMFEGLGTLPLFNPDLEPDPPAAVRDWRTAVDGSDALLIACPEYAHGIPGPMKNALDWLVGFEGFAGKRVAIINLSPRAHHAHRALREVLQTMSASLPPGACTTLALPKACTGLDAMASSFDVTRAIRAMLEALRDDVAGSTP